MMGSSELTLPSELGHHLTGMDNMFFQLEHPRRLMTICSVWMFEQRLDTTLILDALEKLCSHYPRFCLVPKHGSLLETPIWSRPRRNWKYRDNLIFHTLKSPTAACLQQYTASQYVKPFDGDKPLWEVHFISGLENNQFAFLWKAHHSMSDGVGIMKAVLATTTSFDAKKETSHLIQQLDRRKSKQMNTYIFGSSHTSDSSNIHHPTRARRHQIARERYEQHQYERARRKFGVLWQQLMVWFLWSWQLWTIIKYQVYHEVWTLWLVVEPLLQQLQHVLLQLLLCPLILISPTTMKRKRLPRAMTYDGEQTHGKLIAWTDDMDVADIHMIQRAFGGKESTLNDVMLMVFVRTIRRYLQQYYRPQQQARPNTNFELRIIIPLSFRSPTDWTMKNIVTGNIVGIDVDSTSSSKMLKQVHQRMMTVKRSLMPHLMYSVIIQTILRYFPFFMTLIPTWMQHLYTDVPHAIFTNIAGPIEPTYFAGQQMTGFHVLPPQTGKGSISAGLVSYCDKVNVSMLTDNHPHYPDLAHILCKIFVAEFNALVIEAKMKPEDDMS
ncbi:wax ester synthase-like acyl-CoA acyltransferase domain-containing protein [Halteromyces radiatus]|uniref:wax ester synthase-like acyl-CoA acyltransferase domain-containing protein n=1 Tax=Halteromyces radiatus TaxID=101107 RepID=UPI00221F884A|nr:wax ester synthase-like acyl-CoA acyltransferase domain-containing protein [Halteromyces radiatus]KAI8097242.1 wax ester synthase-like acyl-CoA acyltransferase domain-containing protein [Halteromyces radiatus]